MSDLLNLVHPGAGPLDFWVHSLLEQMENAQGFSNRKGYEFI